MRYVLAAIAALLLVSCGHSKPAEPVTKYAMRGEVTQLDAEHQVATIKHEEIKGWMHAMTMEYSIRDHQDFARLHAGDRIDATVFVQGDDYWVGDVHPAPKP